MTSSAWQIQSSSGFLACWFNSPRSLSADFHMGARFFSNGTEAANSMFRVNRRTRPGTARRSPFPSSPQSFRPASPGSQCGSWPLSVLRRASAFLRAQTRSHHPAESLQSALPTAAPAHCLKSDQVCPSGCVCHAVRAPGSNVTWAPTRGIGRREQRVNAHRACEPICRPRFHGTLGTASL